MTDRLRVCMTPFVRGEDPGDGGIRRVVEGLQGAFPALGIELVSEPDAATDLIACHIQIPPQWLREFPQLPFVVHSHGLYWSDRDWHDRWYAVANADIWASIRQCDAVTAPTEWVAQSLRMNSSRHVPVLGHGIDAENWTHRPLNPPYVLWDKSRPDPVCDPDHMNTLAEMLPDVRFISTFGRNAPNVAVIGHQTFAEAKALTEGASAYLCTAQETFGVSILQALAVGIPTVGWRWGGATEIIEHRVTGYLARPYDWADLAAGVRWALSAPGDVAVACRAAARRYTWETAAARYAALYRRLVEAHRTPRPRTSIVVTAYKLDQYLPATLDSVLAQVDPDWECIVVDDASPDRCGAIADEYAARDPRFRALHNAKNLYQAGARNAGIAASTGRYILPLDADDMLPPHAVSLLAAKLDADRSIGVAYGNVRFVEPDGATPIVYRADRPPGHSNWPEPYDWERQLSGQNLLPYSSMFRRLAWEETAGYRERCKTGDDPDFWARVSSYGWRPAFVTDADTLIYRVRSDSMSRTLARVDHSEWFGWRLGDLRRAPAGAVARTQPPTPSFDPPALSVVIPVGPGHERLVRDAVDSVEAQTYRQWECIVVNDSGGPLPPLPPWVRQIDTEGRRGPAWARNLGVTASRAHYYLPLDADDLLEPGALETLFRTARAYPGHVVYSDFWEDPMTAGQWARFRVADWDPSQLLKVGMIGAVTALTPRQVWIDAGGYDTGLSGWEDWGFQLAYASAGVCAIHVPAPLWNYRKHSGKRREENYQAFDSAKADILKRWSHLWDGRTLMACSSCRSAPRSYTPPTEASYPQPGSPDLVAVLYDGDRDASHSYRSPTSGQRYIFAHGIWRWVLPGDAPWLLALPGFKPHSPEAIAVGASEPDSPTLVSHNPG